MFKSLPLTIRNVRATEAVLERIYAAAYHGLKGDALAAAAGLRPAEYRQLKQLDEMTEMAELKGRADSELANSKHLHTAAAQGDSKAALAILTHAHGWVAKQQLQVTHTNISITAAIEQAQQRLEHAETDLRLGGGTVIDVEAVEPGRRP